MNRIAYLFAVLALAVLTGCQGLGVSTDTGNGNGGSGDTGSGGDMSKVQHIIIIYQENRSFDQYFAKLNEYRAANNIAGTADVMAANFSNPSFDRTRQIPIFRFETVCHENVSPAWNESHVQANANSPNSTTATMDGFAITAAQFARDENERGVSPQYTDLEGLRAMGYFDQNHLPYYYWLASTFATSDRWFSPVMSRSAPNRIFGFAGTTAGHAYPPPQQLAIRTIFDQLDEKGVSWKLYYTDTDPSDGTAVTFAKYFSNYSTRVAPKTAPLSQYFNDLAAGTLPAVSFIESGYLSGKDEHPVNNVQVGSAFIRSLIDALMKSSSWKDSVFIVTYDEAGGVVDHVPPAPAVHPDGIAPLDLKPGDFVDDFTRTGFRVPVFIVSPFARRGFISHTPMDFTATLKFIQTRFALGSLTKRDAAQPNMSEFFNFNNPPWLTPPTQPEQPTNAPCYHDRLP